MKQIGEFLKDRCSNDKGFTLIEIIAVLIIIAIVAAVVLSRGTSTAEVDLKAKAEVIKGHIRFVQMRAMNMTSATSGCNAPFGMAALGVKYYMFKDCTIGSNVVLPGAESSSGVDLPSGSTFPTFSFDNWGSPFPSADGTGVSSDINLTIGGETIKITKNTWYVP